MEFRLVFHEGNLQLPERIEFCAKDELTAVVRAQELARGHNATLWSGAGPRSHLGHRIIGFMAGAASNNGSIAPDTE